MLMEDLQVKLDSILQRVPDSPSYGEKLTAVADRRWGLAAVSLKRFDSRLPNTDTSTDTDTSNVESR